MKVEVTDRNGMVHALEGKQGGSLMRVIFDADLGIAADCGGNCSCATCHVYVAPEWFGRTGAPHEEEEDMLDEAFDVKQTSRLACQIELRPDLDGLAVTIAPDWG